MTQWPPPQDPNQPNPDYGQPQYGQPQYGQPAYPPPQPYYGAPVPGGQLAGMGARFGGLLLDGLILAIPILALAFGLGLFDTATIDCSGDVCEAKIEGGKLAIYYLAAIGLPLAYTGYFVGVRGQTWGHQAAGIRVVDLNTGRPIGIGKAIGRYIIMVLGGALCTIGYWSPYFDSLRRQGWHDKAVGSVVIPAPKH